VIIQVILSRVSQGKRENATGWRVNREGGLIEVRSKLEGRRGERRWENEGFSLKNVVTVVRERRGGGYYKKG